VFICCHVAFISYHSSFIFACMSSQHVAWNFWQHILVMNNNTRVAVIVSVLNPGTQTVQVRGFWNISRAGFEVLTCFNYSEPSRQKVKIENLIFLNFAVQSARSFCVCEQSSKLAF
jgi:hypothetical protein